MERKFVNKAVKPFLVMFIITLLLEIFVFNFRFWQSIGYDFTPISETAIGEGLVENEDGSFTFNGSANSYIEFGYVNMEMDNLYLSISRTDGAPYRQYVRIDIADEGSEVYYSLPEREVVSSVERSKYIKFNANGVVKKMRINLEPETVYDLGMKAVGTNDQEYNIKIDSVQINKSVPFFFVPLRVLGILLVLMLIYSLRYNTYAYNYRLDPASKGQRAAFAALIAINILFAVFIYFSNKFYFYLDRDVYSNLAQALLQGHFDLPMLEPSQGLLDMSNPYDSNLRGSLGVEYYWDYAFFEGKYYVYFGIVPCLLLFLPVRALLGVDLPVNLAMLIFTIIYIIVGFRFIYAMAKRYFKRIPFVTFLMMAELFVFCSGLTAALFRNDLYAIPGITALTFTMLGIDLWLSGIDRQGNVLSRTKILLGSLCMALVAGCRPQLLVGSFFAIFIFMRTAFARRAMFAKNKDSLINTAVFVLPYVVVAAFLMYYNYARFGSVFDFGANYNLTTNDMTKRGFRLDRIPYGIFMFLFQFPKITSRFPFLNPCDNFTQYMGVTIYECVYGGLFVIMPVLLWNFAAYFGKTKRFLRRRKLFAAILICHIFAFIILVADINMAGIVFRYGIDFTWLLILPAFAVYLCLDERYKGDMLKRHRFKFAAAFMISMLCNILIVFMSYRNYSMDYSNPTVYYSIMYALQFWM